MAELKIIECNNCRSLQEELISTKQQLDGANQMNASLATIHFPKYIKNAISLLVLCDDVPDPQYDRLKDLHKDLQNAKEWSMSTGWPVITNGRTSCTFEEFQGLVIQTLETINIAKQHGEPFEVFYFLFAGHGNQQGVRYVLFSCGTAKTYSELQDIFGEVTTDPVQFLFDGTRFMIIDACGGVTNVARVMGQGLNHRKVDYKYNVEMMSPFEGICRHPDEDSYIWTANTPRYVAITLQRFGSVLLYAFFKYVRTWNYDIAFKPTIQCLVKLEVLALTSGEETGGNTFCPQIPAMLDMSTGKYILTIPAMKGAAQGTRRCDLMESHGRLLRAVNSMQQRMQQSGADLCGQLSQSLTHCFGRMTMQFKGARSSTSLTNR